MKYFIIQLNHDNGTSYVRTSGSSEEAVIEATMNREACPRSALDIVEIPSILPSLSNEALFKDVKSKTITVGVHTPQLTWIALETVNASRPSYLSERKFTDTSWHNDDCDSLQLLLIKTPTRPMIEVVLWIAPDSYVIQTQRGEEQQREVRLTSLEDAVKYLNAHESIESLEDSLTPIE